MSNNLNYVQHIYPGRRKIFLRGDRPLRPPNYGPVYACQLWSKYAQTSMERLRLAYSNACQIIHYLARNVSVRPHQANHYIKCLMPHLETI